MRTLLVPGLGERRLWLHALAARSWAVHGVRAELLPMRWPSDEPWENKRARLLARVDKLSAGGERVGLVGVSAGGSAVLNAFSARPDAIAAVVCIAAKVHGPDRVLPEHRQRSAAFVASLAECADVLKRLGPEQRRRILSRYSARDEVVPWQDSEIADAFNARTASLGHNAVIAYEMTVGAAAVSRFLLAAGRSGPRDG